MLELGVYIWRQAVPFLYQILIDRSDGFAYNLTSKKGGIYGKFSHDTDVIQRAGGHP